MRTPSGELHVVDFKTEQIVSIIGPEAYWDDIRHFEIKHNIDTLKFTVWDGTEQAATLMQQNLILKEVREVAWFLMSSRKRRKIQKTER